MNLKVSYHVIWQPHFWVFIEGNEIRLLETPLHGHVHRGVISNSRHVKTT